MRKAFDISTITALVALNNEFYERAVVEFIARGVHTGVLHSPAGDIQPSGRKFELRFCDVYQLRNGKIARHATYYDALGFMQQLGVIPAPGQASE